MIIDQIIVFCAERKIVRRKPNCRSVSAFGTRMPAFASNLDMNILSLTRYLYKLLFVVLMPTAILTSCKSDPALSNWVGDDSQTISQYLEKNKTEYSKFYTLLVDGNMLSTLYAYNPYGDDYTLFLPTDDAIDSFIRQNGKYGSFEELAKDTGYVGILLRYTTLGRKVHTDEFPDGALPDQTLTGDRLVASFYADGDNQLILINRAARVIKPNIKLANGYIHVISEVLQKPSVTAYDWLQQHPGYSILAQAMELSGIKKRLTWPQYSLFAEPDSVYHRYGISTVDDLVKHFSPSGVLLTNVTNPFYQFVAYHVMNGAYFTNDFYWGSRDYYTFGGQLLTIYVGQEIRINTGVDSYGTIVSAKGDTTVINYIRPIPDQYNILTATGPVHSISDLMYYKKLPW